MAPKVGLQGHSMPNGVLIRTDIANIFIAKLLMKPKQQPTMIEDRLRKHHSTPTWLSSSNIKNIQSSVAST